MLRSGLAHLGIGEALGRRLVVGRCGVALYDLGALVHHHEGRTGRVSAEDGLDRGVARRGVEAAQLGLKLARDPGGVEHVAVRVADVDAKALHHGGGLVRGGREALKHRLERGSRVASTDAGVGEGTEHGGGVLNRPPGAVGLSGHLR